MKKFRNIHYEVSVTPLTLLPSCAGYRSKEMGKIIGMDTSNLDISVFSGYTFTYYPNEASWLKGAKLIYKHAENNIALFHKLMKQSTKLREETVLKIQSLDEASIKKLPKTKAASLMRTFSQSAFLLSVYSQLGAVADHHHSYYTDQMEKIITQAPGFSKLKIDLSKIINILSTPDWPYPSYQANKELVKIKDKINRHPKLKKELLDTYYQRWRWLGFGHTGPGLNRAVLDKQYRKMAKVNHKGNLKIQRQKLIKQLSLKKKQQQIFEAARIMTYLKGARMEVCGGIYFFMHTLVRTIAKETKLPKKYLMFCSPSEVIDYLKKGSLPSLGELKKRDKLSIWFAEGAFKVKVLTGQAAKDFLKKRTTEGPNVSAHQKSISGNVAYPGKVSGKVKRVDTPEQIKKVKAGDILVSYQTTPELLPAMKKASAFVTDVGGIVSHAAIVSREMKVPCIVGTKFATKIFKDGDKVEVDANKGVIKKV